MKLLLKKYISTLSKLFVLPCSIVFLLTSCQKNLKDFQNCETTKDSLIFVNKDQNEIYFRTKSIERHPKLEQKLHANNNYEFYSTVNIYSLNKDVSLKEIVNIESFRRINDFYYEDQEFIYFVPQNPSGNYFNILDRKQNIKFSKNKDTVYSQYGTFCNGILLNKTSLRSRQNKFER